MAAAAAATAAAAASIRERQTVALKRMLNFNVPHIKNSTGEPVWKVLIYDRFGQDIISPLLSVKELRDMGITLHLFLTNISILLLWKMICLYYVIKIRSLFHIVPLTGQISQTRKWKLLWTL
ncbi:SCFD1 isoform 2 [Pan troglodytes]|uniref:Sec1 family domain containing 1 n=3 Tax=Homininae TaxID=207598 RepID=G3V5F3_HUMAN|nr:sec1 family domain containing 1 [Homo sapiens]PNI96941.1 SCFD1 isoform 2 [Pan troglodytes]